MAETASRDVNALSLPFVDDTVAAGEEDDATVEEFDAAATGVDDWDDEVSAASKYGSGEEKPAAGRGEQDYGYDPDEIPATSSEVPNCTNPPPKSLRASIPHIINIHMPCLCAYVLMFVCVLLVGGVKGAGNPDSDCLQDPCYPQDPCLPCYWDN